MFNAENVCMKCSFLLNGNKDIQYNTGGEVLSKCV